MEGNSRKGRDFGWLPSALAALAFIAAVTAFAWQLFVYQGKVRAWSEADLHSRAELAAATLAEPLKTLDFRAIQQIADRLKADGLRLRITEGRFFVSESDERTGFFDTCGEPYPADVPCFFEVARTGDFFIGVGRPVFQMLMPFLGALLAIVLAGLVGIAGVVLFFFVTYRQRVRIRELAKLEKFRRDFIADVSHEIKTPLTGILGAVDMMEGESPLLSMIRKESGRLNALVQSILDLARLEREGDALDLVETDLADLVRETAARHPCRISVGEPCPVRCDPQLVERAVSNLIVNAIRHSGTDDISVSLERSEKTVDIVVEDHGVGIPVAERERVFERFHRLDPSRAAETGGAGLGLAIVRRIARLHGGDVILTPAQPHGCRFTFTLPVV